MLSSNTDVTDLLTTFAFVFSVLGSILHTQKQETTYKRQREDKTLKKP